MSAWLLIGLVWASLLLFWFWLGKVFDAISESHRRMDLEREQIRRDLWQQDLKDELRRAKRREDAKATEGTGS